jgi:type III pantothenate kinase
MLLAVDIGNTNTNLGLFEGERLVRGWAIQSARGRTADELAVIIEGLFRLGKLPLADVGAVAIACVVPPLLDPFREVGQLLIGKEPLVVEPGIKTGLSIRIDNPKEVGADRIVNAVAAYERVGGPCIVVDLGTATTFDLVSAQAEYLGGVIAPGVHISAEALFQRASKLPRVELHTPPQPLGKNTVQAIQAGILYGTAGQVDGIVNRLREAYAPEARVVGTGGIVPLVATLCTTLEVIDPDLTLHGLRLLHQRNLEAKR